jgi:long-subunit fatty acid transport protein
MKHNLLMRQLLMGSLGVASSIAPHVASAAMGNLATNYGVLPSDVASAQAFSLFNDQVSATYYNPAALAKDPRGELTTGLMHGENRLTADSDGGSAPLIRQGNVVQDSPTQQVLLGMKTNLSSMTKVEHPLYFGLMLGSEKYGNELMAFQSKTSTQGQFFNYGREPLFLNLGGATSIVPGVDAGLAARITLHSSASLQATSDLAGKTTHENLNVAAKPVLRPILGLTVDWGRALCSNAQCWYNGLETAFAFRGSSNSQTTVTANDTIPGTVPPPGLVIAIRTLDAYQPNIYALGVLYKFDRYKVGLTGELQQWSQLGDELASDTIKDQANLSFRNVFIPRLGFSAKVNDFLTLTSGLSYERSALVSDRSLDVNYLDNDRYVLGLGATTEIKNPWILAYPLRLDFAYQMQWMKDRDFQLMSSQAPSNPYETVTAGGHVQVFTASMSLKF